MEILHKKRFWLSLAGVVTVLFGVFYIGVQQALRYGADEPQTSMVKDVAGELNDGQRPEHLIDGRIQIDRDMAPFIIIYDKFGKPIAGDGVLDGLWPQVPIGVLTAGEKNVHKVTWEPEASVRIAAVTLKVGDNYVLGGRNLQVVEHKISWFTAWVLTAWFVSVVILAVLYKFLNRKPKPTKVVPAKTTKPQAV